MAVARGFGPSYARIYQQKMIRESVGNALRMMNHGQMQKDLATSNEDDMTKRFGSIICEESECDGNDVVKF